MPTNTLTDAACKRATPGDKPYKIFDGHGLALWISTSGTKTWRLHFRIDGKPQQLSLGPYPEVTLATARQKRDEVRAKLRDGIDPRKPRSVPQRLTLAEACRGHWAGRGGVGDAYREAALRGLELHVWPTLGARPVDTLTRADVLEPLLRMDAAGHHVFVRKVRMWLAQVLEWCVERGQATSNVAATIRSEKAFSSTPVEHFAALSLKEVPEFWQRLNMEAPLMSVLACKLLAYTWVRTNEVRGMTWDEIEGDVWVIPKARMKMRRDHLVPLSRQALEIIERMRARRQGNYVFAAEHRADRPMSENAVLALIARVGYKGRMTGHGWRTVASTWANERGYNRDAIERQLAHSPDDAVRDAYNRAEYMPERAKMLQDFADWIDGLAVTGSDAR